MEGHVAWLSELEVKEGQLDKFKALMEEMVAATTAEPGAVAYEWYIAPDESAVHIYEKYADSDAMIDHAKAFMETWAALYLGCVRVTRFVVYGDPSPAAREILDGWRATYMGPWGGFSRFA